VSANDGVEFKLRRFSMRCFVALLAQVFAFFSLKGFDRQRSEKRREGRKENPFEISVGLKFTWSKLP
jgi:hypothetical protein